MFGVLRAVREKEKVRYLDNDFTYSTTDKDFPTTSESYSKNNQNNWSNDMHGQNHCPIIQKNAAQHVKSLIDLSNYDHNND